MYPLALMGAVGTMVKVFIFNTCDFSACLCVCEYVCECDCECVCECVHVCVCVLYDVWVLLGAFGVHSTVVSFVCMGQG